MKLKRDLIAPSYEASMDAFIKTFNDMTPKQIRQEYEHRLGWSTNETKLFIKNLKKANVDQCLDNAYLAFSSTLMNNSTAKQKFFSTLKEQGYNAIVDDNDFQLGKGFTKSPTIIFDSSDVSVTSRKSVTNTDAEYFSELYFGGQPEKQIYDASHKKWSKYYNTDIDKLYDYEVNRQRSK